MKHKGVWIFLCLLCAAILALTLALHSKQDELNRATEPIITLATEQEMQAQSLKTTWTSARGHEEVLTPQLTGESDAAHLARHNAKVALAQEANPPID